MTKVFTRLNIISIITCIAIISIAICIRSALTDNKIYSIISGIVGTIFGIFGVIATLLQWLFPVLPVPKIYKRERLFFILSSIGSILIAVVIVIEPLLGNKDPHPQIVIHTPIVSPSSVPATLVVNQKPTPIPTPTSPSAPYGGSLVLSDSLQNNNSGRWASTSGCNFPGNGYDISSTNYYQECAYQNGLFSNSAFQVRIVLSRGSVGGIEFRRTDPPGGYYFSVGWDGQYVFQAVISNHPNQSIAQGAVAPNSQLTYVLAIVADKSSFHAYINGANVSLPNDSTYTNGSLFLFVDGSPSSRTNTTQAILSNLKVWNYN